MKAPEDPRRRAITLLIAELGPWRLAFAADRVELVSDDLDATEEQDEQQADGDELQHEVAHDLPRYLGQPSAASSSDHRTLSMSTDAGQVRIVVPARLRVETIGLDALIPLPAFVAPALQRLGVESLAVCEGGLAFVMDVDRLARSMTEEEAA